MSVTEEILDVVDHNDAVIGQAPKTVIWAKKLRRRIVHVLVFDSVGRMALQLRGKDCSYLPGYWSTSVGGHVMAGETFEAAALREYKEELGVVSPLTFLSKDLFIDTTNPGDEKFLGTFIANYSGTIIPEKGKVEKVEFFSIEEIKKMVARGDKFHPELLFLLKKHYFK